MPTITTPLERRLYDALRRIARDYESADRLSERGPKAYGVPGGEAVHMAYENIQDEARAAIKGVRLPKQPTT